MEKRKYIEGTEKGIKYEIDTKLAEDLKIKHNIDAVSEVKKAIKNDQEV